MRASVVAGFGFVVVVVSMAIVLLGTECAGDEPGVGVGRRVLLGSHNCTLHTSCSECKAVSSCGWCAASSKCMEGGFFGPKTGSCSDWRLTLCVVADKWILVGAGGLAFLICAAFCCCIWCKCRKRSNRKTQSLLHDYERWVDDMERSTASGAPRTASHRERMSAKYGHLMPRAGSTNNNQYGSQK